MKAFFEMTPEEVIEEITKSGIRGRGGAGFPMGKKWSQVARIDSPMSNMSYVTVMKVTRVHSWMVPSWKEIPIS